MTPNDIARALTMAIAAKQGLIDHKDPAEFAATVAGMQSIYDNVESALVSKVDEQALAVTIKFVEDLLGVAG